MCIVQVTGDPANTTGYGGVAILISKKAEMHGLSVKGKLHCHCQPLVCMLPVYRYSLEGLQIL